MFPHSDKLFCAFISTEGALSASLFFDVGIYRETHLLARLIQAPPIFLIGAGIG